MLVEAAASYQNLDKGLGHPVELIVSNVAPLARRAGPGAVSHVGIELIEALGPIGLQTARTPHEELIQAGDREAVEHEGASLHHRILCETRQGLVGNQLQA